MIDLFEIRDLILKDNGELWLEDEKIAKIYNKEIFFDLLKSKEINTTKI